MATMPSRFPSGDCDEKLFTDLKATKNTLRYCFSLPLRMISIDRRQKMVAHASIARNAMRITLNIIFGNQRGIVYHVLKLIAC